MNQGILGNALIYNSKDEILLLKRSDDDTDFPGNWELPGGKIEEGERIEESIIREVKEESGLSVDVLYPLTVNTFFIGKTQYFEVTYLCKLTDGEVRVSNEHSDFIWTSFADISKLEMSDYMKKTLLDSQKTLDSHK